MIHCLILGLLLIADILSVNGQPDMEAPMAAMAAVPPPAPPPMAGALSSIPMPLPMPPPPMSACLDETVKIKAVNDSCKTDQDCGYPMLCRKGLCTCRENYFPREMKAGGFSCQVAPSQNMPCTDICQKPLTCTNDVSADFLPAGSKRVLESTGISQKRCACLAPAVMMNGACMLACKDDQFYSNGECRKKCTEDEIRINNDCMKRADLDKPCEENRQCTAAFSECSSGKCKCKNGFTANKGKCETKSYSCPFGEPIKSKGLIKQCKIAKTKQVPVAPVVVPHPSVVESVAGAGPITDMGLARAPVPLPLPNSGLEDSCGDDEFCMVEGNVPYSDGASGHCCPKNKGQCPIGLPHPDAICDFRHAGNGTRCPQETHYCYAHGASSVCCPRACGDGTVLVEGRCLPWVQYGDACLADGQCRGHNGVCKEGKCTCGGQTVLEGNTFKSPTPVYQYCRLRCDFDQVQWNGMCIQRLKLGEACQQGTFQCPLNAYCSPKNVCTCHCGYNALGDSICGPQAYCREPLGNRPIVPNVLKSIIDVFAKPNTTLKVDPQPSNFTYCKVSPGAKSPLASAVDQCPAGQSCSSYMESIGVCCPTPKPVCPSGAPMDQKCDPQVGCGKTGFCYRYFFPANVTDTSIGYICCPNGVALPNIVLEPLTSG